MNIIDSYTGLEYFIYVLKSFDRMISVIFYAGLKRYFHSTKTNKTMPAIFNTLTPVKRKEEAGMVLPSLGLVIPFQPSMQKESQIMSLVNYATEAVKTKLSDRYGNGYATNLLARLEKIFCNLNFHSHRKSLAIIITPGEEKIIYLDFHVKPAVFLGKSISLIDLVANSYREPDFMILHLQENNVKLFDANNGKLEKIYEQNHETNTADLFKNASGVIELMNVGYEKPVFITGKSNLVNVFYANVSFSEIIFKKSDDEGDVTHHKVQLLESEISHQWNHWESKFLAGRILFAKKVGLLINNIEAVLQVLHKKADGLLLMDKHFKMLLKKPNEGNDIINISKEFINQIEHFLARGNRIEITETGLLKDMGGIVLLRNIVPGTSAGFSYRSRYSEKDGVGILF